MLKRRSSDLKNLIKTTNLINQIEEGKFTSALHNRKRRNKTMNINNLNTISCSGNLDQISNNYCYSDEKPKYKGRKLDNLEILKGDSPV